MIHFRCPACDQAHELPDNLAGTKGPCPSCGQALQFPFAARSGGKEKSMATQRTEPTARSFVELLRQQIDTLQSGDYAYEHLDIYTAGTDEPWRFYRKDELEILDEQGILVARDGPSDDLDNEEIPEYVIRLEAIVGSQLV
jgi:hypothetical protein